MYPRGPWVVTKGGFACGRTEETFIPKRGSTALGRRGLRRMEGGGLVDPCPPSPITTLRNLRTRAS